MYFRKTKKIKTTITFTQDQMKEISVDFAKGEYGQKLLIMS